MSLLWLFMGYYPELNCLLSKTSKMLLHTPILSGGQISPSKTGEINSPSWAAKQPNESEVVLEEEEEEEEEEESYQLYRDFTLLNCLFQLAILVRSIGKYTLANLHRQYKKYIHHRPKHLLL